MRKFVVSIALIVMFSITNGIAFSATVPPPTLIGHPNYKPHYIRLVPHSPWDRPFSDTCDGDSCDGWTILQTNCLSTQTHQVDDSTSVYNTDGTKEGTMEMTHSECDAEWPSFHIDSGTENITGLQIDSYRVHTNTPPDDDNSIIVYLNGGTHNAWNNGDMLGIDPDSNTHDCFIGVLSYLDARGNDVTYQLPGNGCIQHDS